MRINTTLGITTVTGFLALLTFQAAEAQTVTNTTELAKSVSLFRAREDMNYIKALQMARQKNWALTIRGKHGNYAVLAGVDPQGFPIYKTINNLTSAQTVGTNALWPGGASGLNLSGNSANMKGKIAIWDGGAVRGTHVELAGRVVQKDGVTTLDDHATHVSGTLIGTGVNPNAKGMAFQAGLLNAYDFNNDISEMTAAASGLYVSNHSYGISAGWYQETNGSWDWYGNPGDTTDYKFGFYDDYAQSCDSIVYNAPYYIPIFAAGNERGENGPPVDSPYYGYNSKNNLVLMDHRPANLSGNYYYKTIPSYGNAKDIITVGAVNAIPTGYTGPGDVVMSSFSSWGPTTDGRIKPDVVADGVGVFSSISTGDYNYDTYDGTSMATPNTTGSLFLLQEYYSNKAHKDTAMLAATLKALVIHTADEAGNTPGPDYLYGWGLLDVRKAAGVITSSITDSTQQILEKVLTNGTADTLSIPVIASGKGPLLATIAWTDPPATVNTIPSDRYGTEKKLINDLDLRIVKGSSVYQPWVLNPANPSAAATKGDNSLDNVEKVELDSVAPGATYTIRITHKGILARSGSQAFSLILGGVGGKGYCLSAPSVSAGTKIDSLSIGGFHNGNGAPTACTTYSDYTALTANLQGGQTVPLYVSLGSCDGSSASRVVKVYIDYNNDGIFDQSELAATSTVLASAPSASFSTVFTTPANLPVGTTTRMRIVAEETTDTSLVTPCGIYGKGETQDYTVQFVQPVSDMSMVTLAAPLSNACGDSTQIVVLALKNNGTATQRNFPVTATILNGTTTVATLTATYPDTISAGQTNTFNLGSFNSLPGVTYTINAAVSLSGDQDTANNHGSFTVSVNNAATAPEGKATICGTASATLKVTNADSSNTYLWYTGASGGAPVAEGYSATTTTVPSDKTYYLATGGSTSVGPVNKAALGTGGYNAYYSNYVTYTAAVNMTMESARLYTRYPGPITFIVADVSDITANGYEYLPYSTTTVTVYATSPNPQRPLYDAQAKTYDTQADDPSDTGAVFYLNIPLPAGTHQIIVESLDSATIFRNSGIASNPYPIGSASQFAWTGNSASDNTTPTMYQQYYYFFYDAKVKSADCAYEGPRTPVTVTTSPGVTITQYGDSLISSAGSGNQWYQNKLIINGATDSIFQPSRAAQYYTVVNDTSDGCVLTSNTINYVLNVDTVPPPHALVVSPNPTTGLVNISFTVNTTADLTIEVYDVAGRLISRQTNSNYTGSYSGQLNLSGYADGMYLLKIVHGSNTTIKKILLQK
jgi:hypothetical protein